MSNPQLFKEYTLPTYIRDTFGIEGLRHFLGFIVGLEENGRTGYFDWDVNHHLERLGYKRKANGAFDPNLKRKATAIILLLDQLLIVAEQKEGAKQRIQEKKLFSITGFDIEKFKGDIINEKITIRAEDYWYTTAFKFEDGNNPMYTKLLKKIAHESHWEHPLTIYLTPLLSIFWRIKREKKFSVKSLMQWCNLSIIGNHRMYNLRKLESELDYMKSCNYLGEWLCNNQKALPSENENPFDCILTLSPPEWLNSELLKIEEKRDVFLKPKQDENKMSFDEFNP